jgi:hypothetical protein
MSIVYNARYPIRASRRLGLYSTPGMEAPEGASQTFKKGAILVASSGNLVEGGTNPSALVGIADRDGQNASAGVKKVQFTPLVEGILFEASLDSAGALGTYVSLATDLFAEYGVTKDAAGIWYIDVDKTGANGRFRVMEFMSPVGSTFTRVLGLFTRDITLWNAS